VGYEDFSDLSSITRGLVKRGYSDEQIQGILGENALRVVSEVCDRGAS
jgi:membrane dipeptidase